MRHSLPLAAALLCLAAASPALAQDAPPPAPGAGPPQSAERLGSAEPLSNTAKPPPPSTAWERLSHRGGLKLGAFGLGLSAVRVVWSEEAPVQAWLVDSRPLGELSVIGNASPPYMLGGTLGLLAGLAWAEPDPTLRAARWRHLEIFFVTQAVNAGVTDLLKASVGRLRPDGGNTLSFPSGHTSSAFAWATFIWRRHGWQWGLPAVAFATFVAASRVQERRHFPSDVAAGALLGVSLTYLIDVIYGPDPAAPQTGLLP